MQRILTTDDLRETRRHGVPDFPLEYYLDDTRDFYNSQVGWHWHNEFELLLVSEGTVNVSYRAARFCPGGRGGHFH